MSNLRVSRNKISRLLLMVLLGSSLLGCGGKKSVNEETLDRLNQKELQLYTNGRQLYTRYCQNCHMTEGQGLGQLIPPLAKADYLLENTSRAARIIKFGQKGPIQVNGKMYNQPMPANPNLTNQEIQMLLAYIGNAWGNEAKIMGIKEIESALKPME